MLFKLFFGGVGSPLRSPPPKPGSATVNDLQNLKLNKLSDIHKIKKDK